MPEQRGVALVTGGTGGVGLAVAELLAEQGRPVFICARDADRVDTVVDTLRGRGLEVAGARADVRDADDVRSVVRAANERYGAVQVLVNNAGRGGGGVTAELPDELWDDVIATNLTSVFRVTREVLNQGGMLASGWGRVISIASTGGRQGVTLAAPYSASKHGVIGFTKALGLELATGGVTVNAVCPGYAQHRGAAEEDVLTRFRAKVPLGRYSTPQEVAGMVGYLATDSAASITAQALNVRGGPGNY